MPARHAVIIGVNKYPNLRHIGNYDLHGCVNDAKLMKCVLVDKFKFSEAEIVELHDEQASREAILAHMNRLVDEVGKDEVVVFHFSGHGSRRWAGDDAPKDSTIMAADSGRDPKPNKDISDIEVNEWLGRLSQKTRYITLVFDCCHSGTMTRDAFADTARVVVDDNRTFEEMGVAPPVATRALDRPAVGPSGWLALSESYVVMSGCRDDQLSREFAQEDKGPEFRNGALTYFLTQALLKAKPGSTYRDVFESARLNVIARYPKQQNPQIEGRQDREVFGIRDIEPIRFIPVEAVNGDAVTLAGGAAHGLHSNSLWSVYAEGTKSTDGVKSLGVIEIKEVAALTTKAVIREHHAEITAGARCVELVPSQSQFQLKVDLSELPDDEQDVLKASIEKSPLLTLSKSADTADFGVFVLQPRESVQAGDHVPQVDRVQTPTWAVVDAAGVLAMPLHPTNEDKVVTTLIDNLETLARYRNALNLDNPNANLDVQFNIYRMNDKGEWDLANGGDCVFTSGDRLSFEIVNTESKPVYVSLLNFEATGAITLFYPPRGTSELVEAGKTLRIGRDKQVVRVKLSDKIREDEGIETLKAFITSDETDFRWLQQAGTRAIGSKTTQLRKQFEAAFNGPSTRAISFESEEEEEPEAWMAVNRCFQLRRNSDPGTKR